LLAGLASVTDRVGLGPLVACLNFHQPVVLAKMAATVDELSGGRLVVAVGAGGNRTEFDALGIPYANRATRLEEAFEIVRRLLGGERVSVDGRWHATDDAVLLPRPARRPPLMIGSTGERVLAAALPHVDAWNTWFDWFGNSAEGFARGSETIDEACERAGRDPSTVERSACVLVRFPGGAERPDDPAMARIGPADLPGALRGFAEAGADEVILVSAPITAPSGRALRDRRRGRG